MINAPYVPPSTRQEALSRLLGSLREEAILNEKNATLLGVKEDARVLARAKTIEREIVFLETIAESWRAREALNTAAQIPEDQGWHGPSPEESEFHARNRRIADAFEKAIKEWKSFEDARTIALAEIPPHEKAAGGGQGPGGAGEITERCFPAWEGSQPPAPRTGENGENSESHP